jgi:hypothetical protein
MRSAEPRQALQTDPRWSSSFVPRQPDEMSWAFASPLFPSLDMRRTLDVDVSRDLALYGFANAEVNAFVCEARPISESARRKRKRTLT